MRLDGDAAFPLQVHGIQHLGLHLARSQGSGQLQQAVGQRGFAVINMGNDRKIAQKCSVHGCSGQCLILTGGTADVGRRTSAGLCFAEIRGLTSDVRYNLSVIVLASASPRRQELLRNAGIPFTVHPANIPEIPQAGESPRDCAERLAREKAQSVLRQQLGRVVLGADTIVVVEGEILGKPRDEADAMRMLRLLSGRTHQVITGVCLVGPLLRTENQKLKTDFEDTRSETTLVSMTTLTDNDIHSYIATGEPMDKAGAYAIQGMASRWIPRVEGDYFNVVGLPVSAGVQDAAGTRNLMEK